MPSDSRPMVEAWVANLRSAWERPPRSVGASQLRVPGPLQQLLGGSLVTPKLGDLGQVPPCPGRQLPVAQLFGGSDRESKVLLGFVEPAHVPLGDAPRRPRVRHLPARTELAEDRHATVKPGQCFLAATEVV